MRIWLRKVVSWSRREALDRAVDLLREEAETVEELRGSPASIERGGGAPLDVAAAGLRAKLRISKDADAPAG